WTRTVPESRSGRGACSTWRTVPESSLRRVMELSARTVPTEVVVGRYCRARATARVTDSMGSGWLAAAASAFRAAACFQATRLPAVTRSVPSSTADPTQPRLFMRRRLRIRADLLLSDKGEALCPVLDVGASLKSTFQTVSIASRFQNPTQVQFSNEQISL